MEILYVDVVSLTIRVCVSACVSKPFAHGAMVREEEKVGERQRKKENTHDGVMSHKGSAWDRLGAILAHLVAILRPSWHNLGTILGPIWDHLGQLRGQLRDQLRDQLRGQLGGPPWGHLGPARGHLGTSWGILVHLGTSCVPTLDPGAKIKKTVCSSGKLGHLEAYLAAKGVP